MFLIHSPLAKIPGMGGPMADFIVTLIWMSTGKQITSKFIGQIKLLVEIVLGMNMHQLGKGERRPQGNALALSFVTMTIVMLLSSQKPHQRRSTSSSTSHVFVWLKSIIKHVKYVHFPTNGLKEFMLITTLVVFSIYSIMNESTLKICSTLQSPGHSIWIPWNPYGLIFKLH